MSSNFYYFISFAYYKLYVGSKKFCEQRENEILSDDESNDDDGKSEENDEETVSGNDDKGVSRKDGEIEDGEYINGKQGEIVDGNDEEISEKKWRW